MKCLPKVRTANIVVQNLKDEVLIYDLATDRAFCLNETMGKVFNSCNGQATLTELKNKHQLTDDLIHFALGELQTNNLIESEPSNYFAGLSRREVIKRAGLTSLAALPVIHALTAPTAANAASNCPSRNGGNIPSGCPAGMEIITFNTTCSGYSDANKTFQCNDFHGIRCQSGSAQYAANSCQQSGNNIRYTCVCS